LDASSAFTFGVIVFEVNRFGWRKTSIVIAPV